MRVGIVGAGIGGSALAVALKRRGIESKIFERAPASSAVGAGIVLSFNGFEVMKRLELSQQVLDAGQILRKAAIVNKRFQNISSFDVSPLEQRLGGHMVALERSALHHILLNALPSDTVQWKKEGRSFQQREKDIVVDFTDGTHDAFDVLVAADGLHSPIREQLFPHSTPRYSGQTSWRAITPCCVPDEFRGCNWEAWGDGVRFGLVELPQNKVYWYAVAKAPLGEHDDRSKRLEQLLLMFAHYHPVVTEVLKQTSQDAILRTDISDIKPLTKWSEQRLVLLGDAAHATTPNLGQGGNQALEDAWALAACLAEEKDFAIAIKRYESIRLDKANAVIRQSRLIGSVAHVECKSLAWLRDSLLRCTPARTQVERLAKLAIISP